MNDSAYKWTIWGSECQYSRDSADSLLMYWESICKPEGPEGVQFMVKACMMIREVDRERTHAVATQLPCSR